MILVDLMMPVMNGVEFLREKELALTLAPIPVVLISADAHLVRKAVDLHVADYIPKPINLDQLVSTIERHCRGTHASPTRSRGVP